jgi:peptide/nickel transport system permease protein
MVTFLLRRAAYGLTVLLGVVTLVFFLFTFVPDPARELAGQSESEELVANIRKKLSLDLPSGVRYVRFLNDLSPLSVYAVDEYARWYRSHEEVGGFSLGSTSSYRWVLKRPYLGRSWMTDRPVNAVLAEALPGTFILALVAMTFAMLIGVTMGIVSAWYKDRAIDRLILLLASVGMSGPSFFMAILIAWLFGYLWFEQVVIPVGFIALPLGAMLVGWGYSKQRGRKQQWSRYALIGFVAALAAQVLTLIGFPIPSIMVTLPGTGLPMNGSLYAVDVWEGIIIAPQHLILPALTLGVRPLAVIAQLTRNSVLEVWSLDYIRTARAKGLSERAVMLRHVLRNALNPVITAASGWLASMLAGAVFVEFVFGWKGLGLELFRSLEKNDLPMVMGGVIVVSTVFVVINTLVDIIYGWIDPRVRLN